MATRGDRLREARKAAGFSSAAAAARSLNIPVATYNAHERAEQPGARDYGPEDAAVYARRFHVEDAWLLTGKGRRKHIESHEISVGDDKPHIESSDIEVTSPPIGRRVPIKGYVGAGSEAHYYALADDEFETVEAPHRATDKTVAVEIKGKSFGPLMDSWLVFYDDVRSPITEDLFGETCVVGLADDRILLKQIKREANGSYTLLSNSNEPPITDAIIEWAAKVTSIEPRK